VCSEVAILRLQNLGLQIPPRHTKRRLGKLCITGDLYRRLESSGPAGSRVSRYKQRETSLGYYSRLWLKQSVPEVTFMPLVGFAHVVFTKLR
jgi:hypothetical protein